MFSHPDFTYLIWSFVTLVPALISLFFLFLYKRTLYVKGQLFKKMQNSEKRYRRLVDSSPEAILIHDGSKVLYVNEKGVHILKAGHQKDLIGMPIASFVHSDFKETTRRRIEALKNGGQVPPIEQKILLPDGTPIYLEIAGYGIQYEDKRAIQLVIRDLTEQKAMKKAFRQNEQQYRSLFYNNPDSVYSLDRSGIFTDVNPAAEQLTSFAKKELLGMPFEHVVDAAFFPEVMKHFQLALQGEPQEFELLVITKDGRKVPVYTKTIPIVIEDSVIGVYGIAKDVSKEKQAIKTIKALAYTDQLTGLPNRMAFNENLQALIKASAKNNSSIAIFVLDLDNFKYINDTFGHHEGDALLKQVALRLQNSLRKEDAVSRLGGDEFVVILENVTKERASVAAERILLDMAQPLWLQDHEVFVTISIGISLNEHSTSDAETMFKHADLALYLAKEQGKNNYQFFTEKLNNQVMRRWQLETALHKALEQTEFQLHYQPQIDLVTGKLAGVEALLRWNSPFGAVPPDEFIPIAEKTGLIVPIGEWVIQEACRQLKKWQQQNLPPIPVSINVSARQFQHLNFIWTVQTILEKEKIDPRLLEIEITETVMLNVEKMSEYIQQLKQLGLQIAIDDFGTGYSSLHVIASLDFDTLKIDKSLIDGGLSQVRQRTIVHAIISAAGNYKRIVVEGIETKEQVEYLQSFCVIGQGYFFSRPLTPKQFEEYLLNKQLV